MEKHKFKKRFGQNFLNDKNILEKISNSAHINKEDLIIEIGPGSGNLTKNLQKYNCNIICYEIDESLKERLDLIKNNKTTIIYKDFLESDIEEDIKKITYKDLYIIANIPYYITTPIIEKIAFSSINPKQLILMMQKEVGERLTAKPNTKEYGYITVLLNYFYDISQLFTVNRKSFYPVPNVDSVVVKFTPKHNQKIDFNKFNNFIKDAFQFKRKNLKNNLKKYNLPKIEEILNSYGYSLNNRAENIPLEVFIDIVNNL